MLGIMTRPAVNRQDTLNLLYAETGWIKHDYKSPAFINPVWLFDYKSPVYIWIAPLESCAYKSLGYIIQIAKLGWIFIMILNE